MSTIPSAGETWAWHHWRLLSDSEMEQVRQDQPLSMAWCLECHRSPQHHLRPRDQVTNMAWDVAATGKTQVELGTELAAEYHVQSPQFMTSCTTCHR